MQSTIDRPLNNQELAQHLAIQGAQLHSIDPQVSGYVPPEERAMHEASSAWLVSRADHTAEPLVTVGEGGTHELSAESLMADADELRAWFSDDIRSLKQAIENPRQARQAIWDGRKQSGLGDQEAESYFNNAGGLSITEAKAYLNTIRETTPTADESDRDMHEASVNLTFALLDSWKHRQDPRDERDEADMPLALHEASANQAAPGSLHSHLVREQGSHEQKFHELNEARIRDLGETVLDAVGVREQIDESLSELARRAGKVRRARGNQQRLRVSTERTTTDGPAVEAGENGPSAAPDGEDARYRELLRGTNISTGGGRATQRPSGPFAERAGDDTEKSRLAEVEQAARDGALLSWEPEGATREELEDWARTKAQQIRGLTLMPMEFRRLSKEQNALIPTIHQEGYGGDAQARYKQIAAITGVHTFQTSDPEIIEVVLREMTPVLRQDYADNLGKILGEIRAAHARKPKAQFAFTFNRNADDAGSQTFGFMHSMPN